MKPLVEATLYRDAGAVQRYHTHRTLRQQTVAEHTFGVVMLIMQVYPTAGHDLLRAAMHHDLPELFTGDIPAPTKKAHPDLNAYVEELEKQLHPLHYDPPWLSSEDRAILKWADTMECVLWCLEEWRLGNHGTRSRSIGIIVRRALGWVKAGYVPLCARALTDEVIADAESLGLAPHTGKQLEEELA